MRAAETPFLKFLQKGGQFTIPIYQRTYSWTEKQCERLWSDILKSATDDSIKGHFIGSIVYVEEGLYQISTIPNSFVIDGQQRLTTLSLLLTALRDEMKRLGLGKEISPEMIDNYYLFNMVEKEEKRYKLLLTQSDKTTFINLILGHEPPKDSSKHIIDNFNFFKDKICQSSLDFEYIFKGINKLFIVDIALDRNYDNPQRIFESLNSTGLELSQADLIRNYALMGLKSPEQKEIYDQYWYPMEQSFGQTEYSRYFDRFMRDFLTIRRNGQIPNIREVYDNFKEYTSEKNGKIKEIVEDVYQQSKFFTRLVFDKDDDPEIREAIKDINTLKVDVAYPFLLEVISDYSNKIITKDDILHILRLVESYVFRRVICGIPTNTLNKTFATLSKTVNKDRYLESVQAAFALKTGYRKFPNDEEFQSQFMIKDVYNIRNKEYLLRKLENHNRKETVNIQDYTIEHIMPQDRNLSPAWKQELGEHWEEIHNKYLHSIGNLTLTGYNSELSNKTFLEKRNMESDLEEEGEDEEEDEIEPDVISISELGSKMCPKCGEVKPIDTGFRKRNIDGKEYDQSWCISCR
ncbi:MAG: DUF262 domain-containing protein [Nitrosotalea sp.]